MVGCSGSSTGTAASPVVSFSPASLTFPSATSGVTSSPMTETISNTGNSTLAISSIGITGTNASNFAISGNTCTSSLAAGANCTVMLTFTPNGAGSFSAELSVADSALGSPQGVALTGTGTAPTTTVSFSPSPLAFGSVALNATTSLSTTLTNTGSAALTISGITLSGTNASSFTVVNSGTTPCGSTVVAGGTCTITLKITPTAGGSYSATLNVADNVSGSPQAVAVTATAAQATATMTSTTLAFGNVLVNGTSGSRFETLTNTGTVPVTITGTSITGTNPTSFAGSTAGTCGALLAVGANCTIGVTFTPGAVTSYSGTVNVADNATGSPQTASLTGSGILEGNHCSTINNTSPAGTPPTSNYAGTALTGTVLAGLTPVVGASVQVYSAGTAGNGSAPTALGTAVTTGANGKFSVPGSFVCPLSNSVLYAVARGGTVGAGSANAGIELMAVLGPCNSLTGTPNFTLDEATTTASAWALAQFLGTGGAMGASATNSSGITLAAATASNLVNMNTGSGAGVNFPGTGTAPTARINSAANLLNACVASGSNTSSACTGLYAATTVGAAVPNNTLDAALSLAKNPGANVSTLYTLSGASTAYSPVLSAAPADWTLPVNYGGGGMKDPTAVAVDSLGNVWVSNYYSVESVFNNNGAPVFASGITGNNLFESYGEAIDVNNNAWVADEESAYAINSGLGSLSVLNDTGSSVGTYSSGDVYFPLAVAFDPSGTAWIADYGNPNAGVVLLSATGVPLSGSVGYSAENFDFPAALGTDSMCNAWVANQSSNTITMVMGDGSAFSDFAVGRGPSGVAVDPSNNVWSANFFGDSLGLIRHDGVLLSGTGLTGGGVLHPQGIATDGAGTAWVANYRNAGISEFSSATATTPGVAISPATGWGADAGLLEAFGLAIDASGNVWVTNFATNTLTEFVGLAVPVKTPLLGPTRVP